MEGQMKCKHNDEHAFSTNGQ